MSSFNGQEMMNTLQDACNDRGLFLAADLDPVRKAKDCDHNAPLLILVVANDRPVMDNIILSQIVPHTLDEAANSLLKEVMEYPLQ